MQRRQILRRKMKKKGSWLSEKFGLGVFVVIITMTHYGNISILRGAG